LGFSIKIWEIIEIEREKGMKFTIKEGHEIQDDCDDCDQNPGLSKMKIQYNTIQ
jgi:hypothetical protein